MVNYGNIFFTIYDNVPSIYTISDKSTFTASPWHCEVARASSSVAGGWHPFHRHKRDRVSETGQEFWWEI